MAEAPQQRKQIWAADSEIDEDLQDVDLSATIGNYAQNGVYDDGEQPHKCCTRLLVIHSHL